MTEEQAKTKWCPNTGSTVGDAGRCLGSGCMAWRHLSGGRVYHLNPDGSDAYSFPAANLSEFEHRPREFRTEPAGGGYCGLAGSPA